MPRITVGFGVFLIIVGVVGFLATQSEEAARNVTALIPAAFGLILLVLGALAQRNIARKHVMHLAALLGLLGVALPGWRIVLALSQGQIKPAALTQQSIMAASCAVFLCLCVKSFIDVRRGRASDQPAESE